MKKEVSILIPTFNDICVDLVKELSQQATALGTDFEIIVGDDGSSDSSSKEANRAVNNIKGARFIERENNEGRSAIRNFLVSQSQYDWIVFIDSDMTVARNNFLKDYLCSNSSEVIYGGYSIPPSNNILSKNLRYKYESHCMPQHTVENRRKSPFKDFHTSNFMSKRQILIDVPFDQSFRNYGYEDIIWGKQLKEKGYNITHIDNPIEFSNFESNDSFVAKTEECLNTLYKHRIQLKGYSRLIYISEFLKKLKIKWCYNLIFSIFKQIVRKNLQGCNPSIVLFNFYRLGYYICLEKTCSETT